MPGRLACEAGFGDTVQHRVTSHRVVLNDVYSYRLGSFLTTFRKGTDVS